MSLTDFGPGGYREWFINSLRYDTGNQNVPTVVTSQDITDVEAMTVLEAQIPFTFYTINTYNNKMRMRERTTSATPASTDPYTTITLIPGNYTSASIITALLTAISTAGLTGTYACTYSSSTGKLTLSCTNKYFDILFTNIKTDYLCTTPLGFDPYQQQSIINTQTVTFPNCVSLSGPSWIMIRATLGLGSGDSFVTCDDGEIANLGNVLAAIPVNCVPGNTITWTNPAPRGGFFRCPANTVRGATLWCTNGDDDTPLDFNGQPFQLKLAFMTRRDNSTTKTFRQGGGSVWSGPG